MEKMIAILRQNPKKLAYYFWLMCLFNVFGLHRLYIKGIKSKGYVVYFLLNIGFLISSVFWLFIGELYGSLLKFLTVLIYFILVIWQLADLPWIDRENKKRLENLPIANVEPGSQEEIQEQETVPDAEQSSPQSKALGVLDAEFIDADPDPDSVALDPNDQKKQTSLLPGGQEFRSSPHPTNKTKILEKNTDAQKSQASSSGANESKPSSCVSSDAEILGKIEELLLLYPAGLTLPEIIEKIKYPGDPELLKILLTSSPDSEIEEEGREDNPNYKVKIL